MSPTETPEERAARWQSYATSLAAQLLDDLLLGGADPRHTRVNVLYRVGPDDVRLAGAEPPKAHEEGGAA